MVVASDVELRIESGIEPFSDLPLLCVGGHWHAPTAQPGHIEIRTHGQTLIDTDIQIDGDRWQFGTQLPHPQWDRIQIVHVGSTETLLYDGPPQLAPKITPPASFPKRVLLNLTSGQLFSLSRWSARWNRYREQLANARYHRRPLPQANPVSKPWNVEFASHHGNFHEGAPRQLRDIAEGLHQRGLINATLSMPSEWGCDSSEFVRAQWTPRGYDRIVTKLRSRLEQHRPDALFVNTLLLFPLVEAAALAKVPCLWLLHESYAPRHRERFFSPVVRERIATAFRLASQVIAVSRDCAECYSDLIPSAQCAVIRNGLIREPIERALPAQKPRSTHILSVGTICERKGQHTLVEAMALLKRSHPDFVCELVGLRGNHPYTRYLQHLIHRESLEQQVRLVAETDDVWSHYRKSTIYVCTSHLEAYNRSILEAQGFGLPIVTTPCPGVNEQVIWDRNALRFEFGDANQLAAQLQRLIEQRPLWESLARESRLAFERHPTFDDMLNRYSHLLSVGLDASRCAA